MDILKQNKLSRSEWESIEIPVSDEEKKILSLIRNGYMNINQKDNYTLNILKVTKIEASKESDLFLYKKYFKTEVDKMIEKYGGEWTEKFKIKETSIKKLKSADNIRIQNADTLILQLHDRIYEFLLLKYLLLMCKALKKKKPFEIYLYTLIQWRKATILHTNAYILDLTDILLSYAKTQSSIMRLLENGVSILEKNPELFKCEDISLFSHQKELFSLAKMERNRPKLLLYTAPTGTGKTLSPLGLSEQYKIIFVCVARHVGLALAKSAISIEKKVAFAFGCETASDIRLHYFSAIDYEINRRSGGIGKVDNSNGRNVEIMICDVQSYVSAMHYMLAFHDQNELLLYWDEPTITLDYETHPLHKIIHKNWSENKIPNVVLSSATLPKEDQVQEMIQNFRIRFDNALIRTITSYDCRKSIPMITKEGYCFLPHLYCDTWVQLQQYVSFCQTNKTLLRYFDLQCVLDFLIMTEQKKVHGNKTQLNHYFDEVNDMDKMNMETIKIYYLDVLQNMTEIGWELVKSVLKAKESPKFSCLDPLKRVSSFQVTPTQTQFVSNLHRSQSENNIEQKEQGILLTTVDAYTLTDGPSIYLAENIEELASFYANVSNISDTVLQKLVGDIVFNEKLQKQIELLETEFNNRTKMKSNEEDTKTRHKEGLTEHCLALRENIELLNTQFNLISLEKKYIPNTPPHQLLWTPDKQLHPNAFMSNIDDKTVKQIMEMELPRSFKILILLGIGVLIKKNIPEYEELVKKLAEEQKLFLILTSSDYIYGTNYQFCHGLIGQDLQNMTAHKTLQAMGRMGRNKHQQEYSVRFRDNDMIHRLFSIPDENREAINMNSLFNV